MDAILHVLAIIGKVLLGIVGWLIGLWILSKVLNLFGIGDDNDHDMYS